MGEQTDQAEGPSVVDGPSGLLLWLPLASWDSCDVDCQ